jgi:hypothetical protein
MTYEIKNCVTNASNLKVTLNIIQEFIYGLSENTVHNHYTNHSVGDIWEGGPQFNIRNLQNMEMKFLRRMHTLSVLNLVVRRVTTKVYRVGLLRCRTNRDAFFPYPPNHIP